MATLRLQRPVTDVSTGVREEPGIYRRVHLLPTKAIVLLRELCLRVLPPALGAGPEEVLGGEELGGEERVLLHSVPSPLLDALQVEEAVALPAAPRCLHPLDVGETHQAGP